MKFRNSPPSKAPVGVPADSETLRPAVDDPSSLATRLRIARDNLASHEQDLAAMIENLRVERPPFATTWDEVNRLRAEIPKLEDQLKDAVKAVGRTMDFILAKLRVKFSNPCKRSVDVMELRRRYAEFLPNCPDLIRVVEEVDMAAFDVALAAGQIPEAAKDLIVKTPTTRAGRAEIEEVKA